MNPQVDQTPLVVARPLRRIAGFIIDYLIVSVLGTFVLYAFGDAIDASDPLRPDATALAIALAVSASYHIFFLCTMSMTLGKMAAGLYVSDRQGNRLRPDTAILRSLIYLVEQVITPALLISV